MITQPDTIARAVRYARKDVDKTGGTAADRALVALADLVAADIAARDPRQSTREMYERCSAVHRMINAAIGGTSDMQAYNVAHARDRARSLRVAIAELEATGERIGGPANATILLTQLAEELDKLADDGTAAVLR